MLSAQTTLGPGDIAFTGYNSDQPDEFSIVLLKDVVANTTITFTDDEWGNSTATLNTGEGRLTLTFNASFSCSTEFYFLNDANGNWTVTADNGSSANLTLTKSAGNLLLSTAGEALLAFQDPNPGTTTNPARWVAGLNMTGVVWTLGNGSSSDSQLPPGLTNGQTANAITPEVDNAKYNCSTTSGPAANLAAAVNTQSNWFVDNDNLFTLNGAGFCGFTCGATCTDPAITSVSASPNPVCLGSSTTITIMGMLNDGGVWSLRTGGCNGTVLQTTTGNTFVVSPTVTTTYSITSTNCDLTTLCEPLIVTVNGTVANAGPDQLTSGTSTTLAGNNPGSGTGTWTIISGTGGSITSPTSPTSNFSGTAGEAYTLRWTIDNGVCGISSDDVKVAFSLPTSLLLGEMAFTQYVSSNPDYFSVVMLKDIKAGTEVHFTENGWRDPSLSPPGGFRTGEGTLTATWCAAYPCGSEFYIYDTAGGLGTNYVMEDSNGDVAGTVVVSGGGAFTISSAGDQIFAYQGSVPTEADQSNFRAAIHMNGPWDADATSNTESAQPSIFANNSGTSVAPNTVGTEFNNGVYDCSVTASDATTLRNAINDDSNWVRSDTRPANPTFCGFGCQACVQPTIAGTSQNPNPVCAGSTVTITVTGNLNGASRWVIYEDFCGGNEVAASTTAVNPQINFTANTGGTYYVAGVDGCVLTPNCTSFTLNVNGVIADAGADQKIPQGTTSTSLSGNTPPGGATVSWTFADAGDGNGTIASPGSHTTSFSGTAGQSYVLRYTIMNPSCPATSDEVLVSFFDPTDLSLGDIAFVAYNSDATDDFAFVLLTDVKAGTQISFTERGWLAAGGFRPGEQTFTLEFCRSYLCGAEIDVFQIPQLLILDANGKTAATVVSGSPLQLATAGDQIFAYQGTEPTGGNQTNFLAAIQMNGAWNGDATSSTTSAQPSIFTDGVNSISIAPPVDNARYDCSAVGPDAGSTLSLSINDAANWQTNDNSPYALPLNCGISCCIAPTYTSVSASPSDFCPGDVVTLTVVGGQGGGTDWVWYEGSCGTGTQVGSGAVIMVSPTATTTYYVRAEGGCLTSAEACQSVVVSLENIPPTISCPADITVDNDASACTAVVSYSAPSGTDNCPGATTLQTAGLGSGAAFPVGVTTEIYEVTASNGQTASCSFTVMVNDTEDPVITCVATPANRNNDPGECNYTAQGTEFDATATDNCPGVTVTNDFNNTSTLAGEDFPVGTTTVLWTATDALGNTATCSIDIVVTDNEDPVITCQDVTLELGMDGTVVFNVFVHNALVTQSDNCGLQGGAFRTGPNAFTCALLGENPITIFKNDIYGNNTTCNIILTIVDNNFPCNEPPVANCKNVTVDADANCQGTAAAADFNDGSSDPDGDQLSFSVDPVGPYALGETIVVLTVSDGMLTDACHATITVLDMLPPVAPTAPADLTLECGSDIPAAVDLTATDNCDGNITVSPTANIIPGACLNDFTMVRTWTFTDGSGNTSSVSQTITVIDTLAPVLPTIPGDMNLQCASDVPPPVNLTATDNCDGSITVSPTGQTIPGSSPNDFILIRTWTVTDTCGNTSSASQVITVLDTTDPVVDCSAINPIRNNDPGQCSYTAQGTEFDATATDNCAVTSLTNDINGSNSLAGEAFPVGTTNVIWTATDAAGNAHSCSVDIAITDNEAPTLQCQDLVRHLGPGGNIMVFANEYVVSSDDNCEVNLATLDVVPNNFSAAQTFNVTVTVQDIYGNVGNCTPQVTVLKRPTTLVNNGVFSGQYNGTVTLTATLTDDLAGGTGLAFKTVFFSLGSFNGSAVTDANGVASINVTLNQPPGNYTLSTSFAGDGTFVGSTDSDAFVIEQGPTTITNLGVFSGQYSDEATVSALLIDAITGNPLAGRTVTFNLTGLAPLSATTNSSGIATVSFLLDLAPTVLGNAYTISASFAGDSFYLSSSDTDPFTVLQEDAIITYTGAYLVSTSGANSSTATVTLAVTIQDAPDGFPGDIRNARVTFVDRESGDIIAADLPVVLIDPTDLTTGSVVYNWTNVDIGNQNFDEFEIGIIVTYYYTRNSSDDNVIVTVSKPLNNFVTGGGYLLLENSAGSLAGDADSKTNFSINVKFNPSGNNAKGRVQFLVRRLESDGIVHTYRFKSNKISSLAIDPSTGIATVNGKMNIQDITDPNNSTSLGGNRIFQLTLQDNGNPGTNDLLGITVYGNGGGLIFSSNWTGTITAEQHLAGGNIKVHTPGNGNLATLINDPASATFPETQPNEPSVNPLEVQLFPNPATDRIHFVFAAMQEGQWNIDLLDASGALVRQEKYLAMEGSNQHELNIRSLSPGIYWFRLSNKDEVLLARFIRVKN